MATDGAVTGVRRSATKVWCPFIHVTISQGGMPMAQHSSIEWTDATWNPVTGCTKVSPGCKHCYAERMAQRIPADGAG